MWEDYTSNYLTYGADIGILLIFIMPLIIMLIVLILWFTIPFNIIKIKKETKEVNNNLKLLLQQLQKQEKNELTIIETIIDNNNNNK